MPKATMRFQTTAKAQPEEVFNYVSDLTKHGQWAANQLEILPVEAGGSAVEVGRRYTSVATVKNLQFDADLTITEYVPYERFAFRGSDSTGAFTHLFTFKPISSGTEIVRLISFDLSFYLWARFWILYLPVRRPAGQKALDQLKQRW